MTDFSSLKYTKAQKEALDRKKAAIGASPAIDFYSPVTLKDDLDEDGKIKDKESYRSFEVPLNPEDPDSKEYKVYVKVFRSGTAEEFCAM